MRERARQSFATRTLSTSLSESSIPKVPNPKLLSREEENRKKNRTWKKVREVTSFSQEEKRRVDVMMTNDDVTIVTSVDEHFECRSKQILRVRQMQKVIY